MTKKIETTVDKLIAKEIKKNSNQIRSALIEPLSDDYRWSTNGLYFLCARMGGGKTYTIMRHIMITERLFAEPYYDTIIFTSTSGSLDKTVSSLQGQIRTPLTYVDDVNLVQYLTKHLRNKMKWYAVMEFINSGGKEISELMQHILDKHRMYKFVKGKKVIDIKRVLMYGEAKAAQYGFSHYPTNTLLVMDDFATNPLLKKVDSPLIGMLTKTRHYHLTGIVVAQTFRFIQLNLKRLCTDIAVWAGFSMEDFQKMVTQTPCSQDWRVLWDRYKNLKDKHSKMVIHCTTDEVVFDE